VIEFQKKSLLERALIKTKQKLKGFFSPDDFDFEKLEEFLILADLPIDFVEHTVAQMRNNFATAMEALNYFKILLINELESFGKFSYDSSFFTVFLLAGVNGSGKTTTAAKLAARYKNQGISVLLAAADTYRAAGSEQLEIWAERLNLPVVSQQRGADPAAVVFDAIQSAKSKGYQLVIADSAGRLHTKSNLMAEMKKIVQAARKAASEEARIFSFLVLDANFGLNAIKQVESFEEAAGIDYLIGTKLDSSSRAGSLLAASLSLKRPIAFLGTGESLSDLEEFQPAAFVEAFFEGVY
jgi:fused signal recognition particle receptor